MGGQGEAHRGPKGLHGASDTAYCSYSYALRQITRAGAQEPESLEKGIFNV